MSSRIEDSVATILIGLLILFFVCTITGTIVWLLWDVTIPVIFTKLCMTGWLPMTINWWSAVKFSWLVGALFGTIKSSK
jgi:hypothetical protein